MTDPFFDPERYSTITAFARNMSTEELLDRADDKYWIASLDKNDLRELLAEVAARARGLIEYVSRQYDFPDDEH